MQTPGAENAPREGGGIMQDVLPGRPCRPLVMRGLDPRIHLLRKKSLRRRWIAGSSPAMTAVLLDLCCARWTQPTDARNDRRPRSIVSGLLFTMSFATATCRAFQRPSRIQVAARLPTSSRSPINPANTGSTPMPRTTLASRVRRPSQSSPW